MFIFSLNHQAIKYQHHELSQELTTTTTTNEAEQTVAIAAVNVNKLVTSQLTFQSIGKRRALIKNAIAAKRVQ